MRPREWREEERCPAGVRGASAARRRGARARQKGQDDEAPKRPCPEQGWRKLQSYLPEMGWPTGAVDEAEVRSPEKAQEPGGSLAARVPHRKSPQERTRKFLWAQTWVELQKLQRQKASKAQHGAIQRIQPELPSDPTGDARSHRRLHHWEQGQSAMLQEACLGDSDAQTGNLFQASGDAAAQHDRGAEGASGEEARPNQRSPILDPHASPPLRQGFHHDPEPARSAPLRRRSRKAQPWAGPSAKEKAQKHAGVHADAAASAAGHPKSHRQFE